MLNLFFLLYITKPEDKINILDDLKFILLDDIYKNYKKLLLLLLLGNHKFN